MDEEKWDDCENKKWSKISRERAPSPEKVKKYLKEFINNLKYISYKYIGDCDASGFSAMETAAIWGYADLLEEMLKYVTKEDINNCVLSGAIMFIIDEDINEHNLTIVYRMVEMLLDAGADPNCIDDDGETPIEFAIHQGLCDVVGLLLDRGVDISPKEDDESLYEQVCSYGGIHIFEIIKIIYEKTGSDIFKNYGDFSVVDYARDNDENDEDKKNLIEFIESVFVEETKLFPKEIIKIIAGLF